VVRFALSPDLRVVGSADFDDDGAADVVLRAAGTDQVVVWSRLYAALPEADAISDVPGDAEIVGIGDDDGDGDPDLVMISDGELTVQRIESFQIVSTQRRFSWQEDRSVVALCDLFGTGEDELVMRSGSGPYVYRYERHTRRWTRKHLGDSNLIDQEFVGSGDFDGDGRCEFAFREAGTDAVTLLYLDGENVDAEIHLGDLATEWQPAGVGNESP
jgi:hypothetical protein